MKIELGRQVGINFLIAFRYRVLIEVKKSPHSVSTGGHGAGAHEVPSRCNGGAPER